MTDAIERPLRCVVVDDEPLSRRAMRQLLDARDDVDVVGEYSSALELDAGAMHADVLFLDIEMPMRSGIDVAAAIARRPRAAARPVVVFVTAHDEYAVTAFDADVVDYLTKPVAPARLERALTRIRERRLADRGLAATPAPLVARVGVRDVVIPLADVELLEADGVYAAVHARGRRYLVRRSLNDLERALGPHGFLRVHRSYLVRRAAIVEIRPAIHGVTREVVLASRAVVPVSRRQQPAVARALLAGVASERRRSAPTT
jgi:two-component system LytT family response regulator